MSHDSFVYNYTRKIKDELKNAITNGDPFVVNHIVSVVNTNIS